MKWGRFSQIFLSMTFLMSACSEAPVQTPERSSEYLHLLDRNTRHASAYTGINNVFEVRATLMTAELTRTQVDLQSQDYQWSSLQRSEELTKKNQELASRTSFFFSFFAGEPATDDLMSKDSIWRVYLDSNGKRYQGTFEKLRRPYHEVHSLFPAHTRWSTPYVVIFPIATDVVEKAPATLVITGPLAATELKF